MSEYTAIYHPATRRFICKIDFERGIMFVKDRGYGAYIDLTQIRSETNGRSETLQERQSVQDGCRDNGGAGMAGNERGK
jgi:hypothetical protein